MHCADVIASMRALAGAISSLIERTGIDGCSDTPYGAGTSAQRFRR
jgi:hypothetical protein